jgi:hypothetical protein
MTGEMSEPPDALVEQLWRTLDVKREGRIDVKGLKKGLRRMDHRARPLSLREKDREKDDLESIANALAHGLCFF